MEPCEAVISVLFSGVYKWHWIREFEIIQTHTGVRNTFIREFRKQFNIGIFSYAALTR
jgi:hypothetical protein